jgi:hypothetical protein
MTLGTGVKHLGRVVAGAARGQRHRADQPRIAHRPKIHPARLRLGGELAEKLRIVAAQLFAIAFVAAVHGGGQVPLAFAHPSGPALGGQIGQAIHRDRTGKQKPHRVPVPARLLVGQSNQIQGALDIDAMGGVGGELRPRAEQGGQVIDGVNLVLADQPFKQRLVEDVADDRRQTAGPVVVGQRLKVERDDVAVAFGGEALDQSVSDFATGSGNQRNGFAYHGALAVRGKGMGARRIPAGRQRATRDRCRPQPARHRMDVPILVPFLKRSVDF